MNTSVNYLGLHLKSPLMVGASPLSDNLDMVKRMEDSGCSAIVLRSLFEEQIEMEERAFHHNVDAQASSSPEAAGGFFTAFKDFEFDTSHYLEHLRKVKKSVGVPVIASLNGVTPGGWERFAKLIQEAGADALELNFYDLPTDPAENSGAVEARYLQVLKDIRKTVKIPLSVKLTPFFSSLLNFTQQLSAAGANGVVLFNRLYQPDIDVESLEVNTGLALSDSSELSLRLRWLAILEPHFKGSMTVSGGVHTAIDAIKSIMTGASGVQMVSAIMKHGPHHFANVELQMKEWLEEHEYESLEQMRGSMSLRTCPNPAAFSRTNYMKMLHGWSVPDGL